MPDKEFEKYYSKKLNKDIFITTEYNRRFINYIKTDSTPVFTRPELKKIKYTGTKELLNALYLVKEKFPNSKVVSSKKIIKKDV